MSRYPPKVGTEAYRVARTSPPYKTAFNHATRRNFYNRLDYEVLFRYNERGSTVIRFNLAWRVHRTTQFIDRATEAEAVVTGSANLVKESTSKVTVAMQCQKSQFTVERAQCMHHHASATVSQLSFI